MLAERRCTTSSSRSPPRAHSFWLNVSHCGSCNVFKRTFIFSKVRKDSPSLRSSPQMRKKSGRVTGFAFAVGLLLVPAAADCAIGKEMIERSDPTEMRRKCYCSDQTGMRLEGDHCRSTILPVGTAAHAIHQMCMSFVLCGWI